MVALLDTVVVGGGAMGSATAWALATRGREVVRSRYLNNSRQPTPLAHPTEAPGI